MRLFPLVAFGVCALAVTAAQAQTDPFARTPPPAPPVPPTPALAPVPPVPPTPPPPPGFGGGFDLDPELLDQLALKPAQKKAIRDLAYEAGKQEITLRADVEVASMDLRRELDSDSPDEAKVTAYIDKISAGEAAMRKGRVMAWLRIRAQLSPEQRLKLKEPRRERRPEPFLRDPFAPYR